MLIIGAKGFAKEILGVFDQLHQLEGIAFYDDVNDDAKEFLFNSFPILKNETQVKEFFIKSGNEFTIGIGNPQLRFQLYEKFIKLGGVFCSTISPKADLGNYDVEIGNGSNILSGAIFSNSVKIGRGCIIYYNVTIAHDCIINEFVELSPNVTLLGHVVVGSFTQIGASTTVLPKVMIGKNVIIGAGSVVTKDIPDNCIAYGIPAKIIKVLEPLKI
ncbi:acetyltransferase [Flavobacterium glaciei]|uniref:Sugar O-acyltransferase (Sialic acid O-acetyltransferase NeuD family) n=1 Tax=Flavobacterium glaciei TaxID=386300 RepID=A0A562Q5Z8_9FLAO|nr:acetyltransferase [Flavobacterium glaciei]RDI58377.1 sugar O-acyltransferase (sialic acid O-acetyltransferase NeuD family) [Flavobacterium glaciei]TWI52162.1 sugar O-acyltransferase (sialic acid O-acetyltransferase NeuD family) [Flavobacterium glaciei]